MTGLTTTNCKTIQSTDLAKMLGVPHRHILFGLRVMAEKHGTSECGRVNYKAGTRENYPAYVIPVPLACVMAVRRSPSFGEKMIEKLLEVSESSKKVIDALNNFDFTEVPDDMFVYVAMNKATGNIKIGISKDPDARVKQLQTGCDGELEIVALIPAPNRFADESAAHREASGHIHGEWFTGIGRL